MTKLFYQHAQYYMKISSILVNWLLLLILPNVLSILAKRIDIWHFKMQKYFFALLIIQASILQKFLFIAY